MSSMQEQGVWSVFPSTLTILPTYRCTAACEQCCFESNPRIKGRLSREELFDVISRAHQEFSALRAVVFSGGECFLLKDDLYDAIALCSRLGLQTRVVTNGSWAKTSRTAREIAGHVSRAGLTEANISTGSDHQRWVPFGSVLNAAESLLAEGIRTMITIEADGESSCCVEEASNDPRIQALVSEHPGRFSIRSNVWMPFNDEFDETRLGGERETIYSRCEQIFTNLVATPHGRLASCCGLTFEHIPEMKLGHISHQSLRDLAKKQLGDFIKIWISVDGPAVIIKRLLGDDAAKVLGATNHICQACAILYKSDQVREALISRAAEFAPEVLSRFGLSVAINSACSSPRVTQSAEKDDVSQSAHESLVASGPP